jgi:hypothetical protein
MRAVNSGFWTIQAFSFTSRLACLEKKRVLEDLTGREPVIWCIGVIHDPPKYKANPAVIDAYANVTPHQIADVFDNHNSEFQPRSYTKAFSTASKSMLSMQLDSNESM